MHIAAQPPQATGATILPKFVSPPELVGKQFIRTSTLARLFDIQGASIRTALWRRGHYLGMTPRKGPGGQLLWPVAPVLRILSGEVQA
jgi:hypothetical protein